MKKGLWIGLAVCSLAVMTACGNEAKETAAAPTESAVTQHPAEQAALDKAYDEAFVSFESYEGRMEPILKDVQRMVDAR